MSKLRVSEIFTSIEGEGPFTGSPMLFIRTFGCNMTCTGFSNPSKEKVVYLKQDNREGDKFTTGCDSAYSWHTSFKNQTEDYSLDNLVEKVKEAHHKGQIICFTGGEPLLWQDQILKIVETALIQSKASNNLMHVLFETNGSIVLRDPASWRALKNRFGLILTVAVSPKLKNSGEPRDLAVNPKAIKSYYQAVKMSEFNDYVGENVYFKFVSNGTQEQIEEIDEYMRAVCSNQGISAEVIQFRENTWLMPEGASKEQQEQMMERVANLCIENGFKFCARVHVWVFGNRKGT